MSESARPLPSGSRSVVRFQGVLGLAVLVVVALLTPGSAGAATNAATFSRADYQQLGNNHIAVDLNRDALPDIVGQGVDSAAVLLNRGDGTFGVRVQYPVAGPAQDFAPGDFNGDGLLDLAVTIGSPDFSLSLLAGNGDGTFAPATNFRNTTGFDSPAAAATDLNADGHLDLAIAHSIACFTAPCRVSELMSVMLGNGDGSFQPPRSFTVGRGMTEIATGDFNRDGVTDLAVAGDSSRVYRLQGVGDGTFIQQPTLTLTADTLAVDATDIDVADFNRDTVSDLVVAIALNGSRTAVLIGNGDGSFRAPLILTDPRSNVPHYIAVADYNRDSFVDLAMSQGNGTSGLMQIRNGNGDATFQAPTMYLVPPDRSSLGGYAIVSADFNVDGTADIALGVVGAAPSFAVLRNTTGTPPPPVPGAPTLLSPAQGASLAQPVNLDWADLAAAASYRVQVDDSSTFSSPLVLDRTASTSQLTAPALAARRHWWRVRGVNSAGVAGGWSTVRQFTPQTVPTASALSALTITPSAVTGGNSAQGRVTLTSAAPTGGFAVTLASDSRVSVPGSATVAAGATSATFAVTTTAVPSTTPVTITASAGGVSRSATLTVAPPSTTATLSVTATGRSGERVTSNPAGINVSVGSSGSATFSTGTVVTLSATNSRDVVWSGSCSSNGNRTKSCTFTLNGNAAVTAAVS